MVDMVLSIPEIILRLVLAMVMEALSVLSDSTKVGQRDYGPIF